MKMRAVDTFIELKDMKEALSMLENIASSGDANSQMMVVRKFLSMKKESDAVYWLNQIAKNSGEDSELTMAVVDVFRTMGKGYEKDMQNMLLLAAERDNVKAQYELGEKLYEKGSKQEGKDWLRKAADNGNTKAKELLAIYERDEETLRRQDENFSRQQAEQIRAIIKGDILPDFNYIKGCLNIVSWENGEKARQDAIWLSNALTDNQEEDFFFVIGKSKMDELDRTLYKQTPEYEDDWKTFVEKRNSEIFAYFLNFTDGITGKPCVTFSGSGFSIKGNATYNSVMHNNHIKCDYTSWVPIKPNIAKMVGRGFFGSVTYNFPCNNIDILKSIKDHQEVMSVVVLYRTGFNKNGQRVGVPISLYVINKEDGQPVYDLKDCLREIDTKAGLQKELNIIASNAQNEKEEKIKAKGTYHKTPKRELCIWCWGQGFSGGYRCINCYGKGYTLEHYY